MTKATEADEEDSRKWLAAQAPSENPRITYTSDLEYCNAIGRAQGRADAEAAIIAMLEHEVEKCEEYCNRKNKDWDKAEQQGHYSESMQWIITAIQEGQHMEIT